MARSSSTSASVTGPRRNIFVLDPATGTATRVTHLTTEPSAVLVVRRAIAYTLLGEPRIRLVDPATGKDSTLLTAPDQVWDAQWSPDGMQVAYVAVTDDPQVNEIWVMNADGSAKRPLVQSHVAAISPVWSADGSSIVYVDDADGGVHTLSVDPATGVRRPR